MRPSTRAGAFVEASLPGPGNQQHRNHASTSALSSAIAVSRGTGVSPVMTGIRPRQSGAPQKKAARGQ
jgi:hypothetical protein